MQENRVQDSTTVAIVLYLLLETDLKNEKKKKKKYGNWFLKGKYKNNNKIHKRAKNRLK